MILYIPVATKVRDLFGTILLASIASERGWVSVIGPTKSIHKHMEHGPRGIFFSQGIPKRSIKLYKQIKNNGHRIVFLGEGGLVYIDGKSQIKKHMSEEVASLMDIIFVSGNRMERHVREYLPYKGKIVVAGHPRFDTLTPEARVVYTKASQRLKRKYHDFLLVNTNFSFGNPPSWRGVVKDMHKRKKIVSLEDEKFYYDYIKYQKSMMATLKNTLIESGIKNIVIRPHPAENHKSWRDWARFHGVSVESSGSAVEWMMASRAMVHTGCTTGIEASILHTPVATVSPDNDDRFFNPSDRMSLKVESAEDLREFFEESCTLRNPGDAGDDSSNFGKVSLSELLKVDGPRGSSEIILNEVEKVCGPSDFREIRNKFKRESYFRRYYNVLMGTSKIVLRYLLNKEGQEKFGVVRGKEIMRMCKILYDGGVTTSNPEVLRLRGNSLMILPKS